MKQTNNALTFLMAQYRAIFKNAYFKGIASAVVLTAGLAAAQGAQATDVSGGGTWKNPDQPFVTTSDNDQFKSHSSGPGYVQSITIKKDHKLTNSGDSTISVKGAVTVESGGFLIVGSGAHSHIAGFDLGTAWDGKDDNDSDATGTFINNGTTYVGSGSSSNSLIQMHGVTLKTGSTTTIEGSGGTNGTSYTSFDTASYIFAGLGANNNSNTFSIEREATLNLNDNSYIGISQDGTMNIDGNVTLKASNQSSFAGIRGSDAYSSSKTWYDDLNNPQINLTANAKLTVASGSGHAIIFAPEVAINGASIEVQNGGKFLLNGDALSINSTTSGYDFSGGGNAAGIFTMTSGKLDIQSGGTVIVGNGVYESDDKRTEGVDESTFVTTLDIQGGQLTGTGTLEVRGNLNIADTVFTGFMGANGGKGHLTLSGTNATDLGRTITITGSNQIDLAAYDFSATAGSEISVVQNATIKGTNLAVSSKLTDSTGASANVDNKLSIEADNLTLGNAKAHSSTSLGFSGATAENVTFLDSGEFELQDNLNLYAIKDITNPFDADQTKFQYAKEGTIKGKVKLVDSTKPLTIHAGHYTNDYAMTISDGKLQIGGTTNPEDKSYSVDVSLTQNGALNLNGGSIVVEGNGTVEFDATHERDTTATLNIRNAQLTVSGTGSSLIANGAKIMVTEAQTAKLLGLDNNSNSASINLGSDGELDISGELQGAKHTAIGMNYPLPKGSGFQKDTLPRAARLPSSQLLRYNPHSVLPKNHFM